jgi:hypothetical protein
VGRGDAGDGDGVFRGMVHAFVVILRVDDILVPYCVCGALLPLEENSTSSGYIK